MADVDPTDESEWWICRLVPEDVAPARLRAEKKREAGQ
jgi:hypothetical protein